MSPTTVHPDESVLLALAAEDAAAPEVRAHVRGCPSCRRTLKRLKAEVVHLRSLETEAPTADSPPPTAGED